MHLVGADVGGFRHPVVIACACIRRGDGRTVLEFDGVDPFLRPHRSVRNGFFKGHGLGNDYLVVDPAELDFEMTPKAVRGLCERHRGETAASGTSACAAACAAVRRGLAASPVRVRAPGGDLRVAVGPRFEVTLDGPVAEVARGRLSPALVRALG